MSERPLSTAEAQDDVPACPRCQRALIGMGHLDRSSASSWRSVHDRSSGFHADDDEPVVPGGVLGSGFARFLCLAVAVVVGTALTSFLTHSCT